MTRDDIIRMAREAGIKFDDRWGTCYTGNVQIERFAAQLIEVSAAAEREACAKVVEASPSYDWHKFACEAAAAIRARGAA